MTALARFAGDWLDWMIAATWQLALLVCLVAVLTSLMRSASPRLRYGLWLLVPLKALLPPTLTAFWGVGVWGVAPVVDAGRSNAPAVVDARAPVESTAGAIETVPETSVDRQSAIATAKGPLFIAWGAGCLALWLVVAWRYGRLTQMVRSLPRIDEGPVRVELERLASRFAVRRVPDLYVTEEATSPMLLGVFAPKIVLPQSILDRLDPEELRMVLAHELMHFRRRDTWAGWLQVFVQALFWFHPLVWFANARIRHERECACDETVLREARCDRDGYGETIVRVLTLARGRSLVTANLVGIFEPSSRLQIRLEAIMTFDPAKRRFGWVSRAALAGAALVLLPMAVPGEGAQETATTPQNDSDAADKSEKSRPKTNWPTIASTTPRIGATDVDPGLREISVTFDRDMDVNGYSWTGGGEFFPEIESGSKPVWVDKRTCVLPVRLKKGAFYRLGINSSSHKNFRSELGVAAPTSAIYFATEGAPRSVTDRVRVPKVVELSPENGATDVDPGLKLITVTFDMPMQGSFSWTGGGPTFPTIPDGEKPRWSRDRKTCTLPVELKPGTQYELGLNSLSHKNFASESGVPLEPVAYKFQTADAAGN